MVHHLERHDIGGFCKVGIRAQLMDITKGELEMDFRLEAGQNSLHVLNAISPAFTSAFAFAPYLVDLAQATHANLNQPFTGDTKL